MRKSTENKGIIIIIIIIIIMIMKESAVKLAEDAYYPENIDKFSNATRCHKLKTAC